MSAIRPFLVALQFLTRLPVRLRQPPTAAETGRSLLYYPLVGLLLGLALAGLHLVLNDAPALLRAALVLVAWVAITGALHLDGLADSFDAWVGGRGDRERTLAIMKDPRCGPMGVVALVLVLLVKFAALSGLEASDWPMLALVPVIARGTIPLLFLPTPYVRPGGLGSALAENVPRVWVVVVLLGGLPLLWWALDARVWFSVPAAAVMFVLIRHALLRRLGGTTGDTAGALIELIETVLLVLAVLPLLNSVVIR